MKKLLAIIILIFTLTLSLSIVTACGGDGSEVTPPHTHDYINVKNNANSHWLECVCGEKTAFG